MHKEVESQNPIAHYFANTDVWHLMYKFRKRLLKYSLFNNKAYVNRENDVTSTSITYYHHL